MVINSSQALISELEFRSLFRGHSCPACYYYKQKLCTMQGCMIDNCLTNISCGCSKMCLFWPNRAQTTMHPCFCGRHLSPAVPFLPAGTDTSPAVYAPIKIHPDKQKHPFLHGMQRKGCKSTYSHGHAGTGTARYVHLRHFPVRSYDQQFSAKYLMVRTIWAV